VLYKFTLTNTRPRFIPEFPTVKDRVPDITMVQRRLGVTMSADNDWLDNNPDLGTYDRRDRSALEPRSLA